MLALALALALTRIPCITIGPMRSEREVLAMMRGHCFGPGMGSWFQRDTTWFVVWPSVYSSKPLACCAISRRTGHYLLHNVCVHRQHRRRRWASALYRQAIAHCRREGLYREIRLKINKDNAASRALLASRFPQFERARNTRRHEEYRMAW